MTFGDLNTKYLRIELGCVCSAEFLARSWREGRVAPDEILEIGGRRLSFRQACAENPWLGNVVGPLPDKDCTRGHSWWEERRFRRNLWRRIVKDGDYHGFSSFYKRLDEKNGQIAEMSAKAAKAEAAREAAIEEVAQVRLTAKADVEQAKRNEANAREAEAVAKREAADAVVARIAAEEEMRKAQAQKAAAYAARKKAEHALAAHVAEDTALRNHVSSVLRSHIVPDGRALVCWGEGILQSVLSRAIFSFAKHLAPSDVIALYVGDFWKSGREGVVVTCSGIVSSGPDLATGSHVVIPWGWEEPLVVRGNYFTHASVWMGQKLVAKFSSYLANCGSLEKFLKKLDSANAHLMQ